MRNGKQIVCFSLSAFGVMIIAAQVARAGQLAADDVRRAVETWVRQVTADAKPNAIIEKLEPWNLHDDTVAYIAHLEGGGYCLCGANDLVLPVYLYVPNGAFDAQSPSMLFVLDEIRRRSTVLRETELRGVSDPTVSAQLSDRAAYWQALIAGQTPSMNSDTRSAPSSMTLPLTSTWNQTSPYNDFCPFLTPGQDEITVTGCVATATAQIMYYWKWPPTGEGQSSMIYPYRFRSDWDSEPMMGSDPGIPNTYPWTGRLRWRFNGSNFVLEMNGYWDDSMFGAAQQINMTATGYQTALTTLWSRISQLSSNCSANYGATPYNWASMTDSVSDPPSDASFGVATVMYHAGIACLMHWGVMVSSTGNTEKAHALRDHFRYDSDITYAPRNSDLITDEIQWLRPVTIGGSDPNVGGHDWVVYGYNTATDPDRQFMMNFGWGGASNGWYTFDAVNTGNGNFNDNQWHVARIAPRDVVRFVNVGGSGNGKPATPYGSVAQALQFAPDYSTLVFKAGSFNSNGGAVINFSRPMTLKGVGVTITP